jgi:hypothetical protein
MELHTETDRPAAPPPSMMIMQMAMGALMTQALGVAAKLGVADILADGHKNIAEIAADSGTHEQSLYRILRCLASANIFTETEDRTFRNTELSDLLRSNVQGSLKSAAVFMAEPWHFDAWANLMHSAKTGETSWDVTFGKSFFDWIQDKPEAAAIFNGAMTDMSMTGARSVVEAYDFSGITVLADIAGGHGYLLSQILKANPGLQGILFDLDSVIAGALPMLLQQGVADRVVTVSGDFFQAVPTADAYIMKHIIHDWDDERAVKILQSINRAMTGDGKVILVEMVVPPGNDPHPSKVLDLEMLTLPGGLERTADEYAKLFERAGFRLNRILPTKSHFSIIEAVKA